MATVRDVEERINQVTSAWQTLAPAKEFGGMSLEQFQTLVQPSAATRQQITALDDQVVAAKTARDNADKTSQDRIQLVVNGVIGDPSEGPDSDLYEAMGYIRKSNRKSGLTRKKRIDNGVNGGGIPSAG